MVSLGINQLNLSQTIDLEEAITQILSPSRPNIKVVWDDGVDKGTWVIPKDKNEAIMSLSALYAGYDFKVEYDEDGQQDYFYVRCDCTRMRFCRCNHTTFET